MPQICYVFGCGSRGNRDNSFHTIPGVLNFKHKPELNELSKLRREKWITAIRRKDWTESKLKNAKVCGKHFISGQPAELKDCNNPDWVPSLNMGYDSHEEPTKGKVGERWDRLMWVPSLNMGYDSHEEPTKGKVGECWDRLMEGNGKLVMSCQQNQAGSSLFVSSEEELPNLLEEEACGSSTSYDANASTQTDLSMDHLSQLFLNLSATKTIENRLNVLTISCELLKNDNGKCKYYTGFESSVFQIVVEDLKSFVQMHHNTKLPASEQILLTFIKLRLNLDFKDLSYRFGVSPTGASTYFKAVIEIMFRRFQELIFWPDRKDLEKTMPLCFKEAFHDKTSIIIDCFEIFVETPTDPYVAAQCWSNYKHHQTIKYLIGIIPQGTVSYISDGWGGRASDQFITLQSNFCNFLQPGDVVLADRGFLIKEFINLFRATVKTPAFTKGKTQMHPVELEDTRSIASVRIHVERVIGLIRQKYRILSGVMPMSMVSSGCVDKIVFVCCSLINLCPGIIPLER